MLIIMVLLNISFAQDAGSESNTLEAGFTVRGEIQRPEVFMDLNKDSMGQSYELRLRESFLPKILDSLEKAPL